MKILKIEEIQNFDEIIKTLKNGGLVIYPTETSYGVGVDATNEDAVSKLLKYKQRPEGKAISIAVSNKDSAKKYVKLNSQAEGLYNTFLPGPVTIISKSLGLVDKRLESEKETLGVRIPNHRFLLDLLSAFGSPITATSGNLSGKKTPYSVSDILDNLPEKQKDLIDLIIDGGELPKNPSSTVIDTTTSELTTYRQGRIDPTKVVSSDSLETSSVEETILAGEKFFFDHKKALKTGALVILLNGELGAGKTHFTKGIAKALGIKNVIKSPTYNYVNEYIFTSKSLQSSSIEDLNNEAVSINNSNYRVRDKDLDHLKTTYFEKHKLYHFDAWRVQSKEDLNLLRFYDWFESGNVIIIEWPSVVMNLDQEFFEKMNYFYLEFVQLDNDSREIKIFEINN